MEAVNYHLTSTAESESWISGHYGESHGPISRDIDVTSRSDERVHNSSVPLFGHFQKRAAVKIGVAPLVVVGRSMLERTAMS
jgi:hypothetical protein